MLSACDKALNDLVSTLKAKNQVISDLDAQVLLAKQVAQEAEDRANAWYHDPFVLGTLGFGIGVLGGIYAAKH